jgi:hypothetical protein
MDCTLGPLFAQADSAKTHTPRVTFRITEAASLVLFVCVACPLSTQAAKMVNTQPVEAGQHKILHKTASPCVA